MPFDPPPREPVSPRTLRLMRRVAAALGVVAALLFLAVFVLGVVRESSVWWPLLVLAAAFLAFPLLVRRLLPDA